VGVKNRIMEDHILKIDNWEFTKGILNVWWLLVKELWWVWPILAVILIFGWSVVRLEKWIKNKRRIRKSKNQNKNSKN